MVESLLSLRDFYEAFLKKVGEERTWVDAINDAFAKGFSARKNKPAEMIGMSPLYCNATHITHGIIAKSLDAAMRKGQKNATDEEFFVYLRRVLTLYRFSTGEALSPLYERWSRSFYRSRRIQNLLHSRIGEKVTFREKRVR